MQSNIIVNMLTFLLKNLFMVELREFYFMLLHLVAKYFMNMSYKLLQFSEPRFSVLDLAVYTLLMIWFVL